MSSGTPKDTREEHDRPEQPAHGEPGESGHSGEGAASAMEHMISQGEKQRRQSPTPDQGGGSRP